MTRLLTVKDAIKVHEILAKAYAARLKQIKVILDMNASRGVEIDGKLVAVILVHISVNEKSYVQSNVIYISGDKDSVNKLIIEQAEITELVAYSESARDYLQINNICEDIKHIEVKNKRLLEDDKTYRYSVEYLKNIRATKEVFDMVNALDDRRMKFFNESESKKVGSYLKECMTKHADGVYSFKLLNEKYCKDLLDEVRRVEYKVNEDEPYAAQIPEVVLKDRMPEMFEAMKKMFFEVVEPLSVIAYGVAPETLHTAQVAKYDVGNTSMGNWHIDRDSDVTLTVALSDTHKGGGTVIKMYGDGEEVVIPQLPIGHALLFRGKNYMHKGLPVTDGDRNLLVFWSEI